MVKRKATIVTLDTLKITSIIRDKYNHLQYLNVHQIDKHTSFDGIGQYLYFVTDDEIKEGDYMFVSLEYQQYIDKCSNTCFNNPEWNNSDHYYCSKKKIIASTDFSLILPRPSCSFVEKYCNENGISDVMIEYNRNSDNVKLSNDSIVISKIKESWNTTEVIKLVDNAMNLGMNYNDLINNTVALGKHYDQDQFEPRTRDDILYDYIQNNLFK